MVQNRLITFVTLTFALVGAGQLPAAQPGSAPPGEISTPAGRLASHPYKSALGALWNYRSCGSHARAAVYESLSAELRSIEASAVAKGLGPTLERLRQEYHALLSVASTMACAGGPRRALAHARGAIAAFRTWVESQPA
jgi:hypothetical protein